MFRRLFSAQLRLLVTKLRSGWYPQQQAGSVRRGVTNKRKGVAIKTHS